MDFSKKKVDGVRMRVGIDGRMYFESGVGRYIRNLIHGLQILDEQSSSSSRQNEYFIFLLKKDFEKVNFPEKNFHKVLADFKWYSVEEQIKFPKVLKKYNLDLVHFPHFNVPLFYNGKFIVTIHDLIHQNFSMQRVTTHGPILHKIKKLAYNQVFKNAIKKSAKILVPSEFVKEQLVNKWQVSEGKITITSEAVDDQIFTIVKKWNIKKGQKVLDKYGITSPFIFYVGNAHPHKNVEGLIKAFWQLRSKDMSLRYHEVEKPALPAGRQSNLKRLPRRFAPRNDNWGLQLVLAGHDHYFWQRIRMEYQDDDIVFTGYVSDKEMVALYKLAECFVMPSFEEGFGIPILEAMACGCPVISSNGGSLPEVGGDACMYFDPHNTRDMAEKISMILRDDILRKQLIEKGQKRYKQFSWKELAEETLKTYQESF